MRSLLSALFNLSYDISRAKKIKENPEKREKSVRFAVVALACFIFAIPFCALLFLFINAIGSNNLIIIIGGVLFGLVLGIGGTVSLLFQGIKNFFLQLYINKKPITWITLGVMIVSIVSCAIIIVLTLNKI